MTGVGFLILFGLSCVLFSCEGKVYLVPNGDNIVLLPGSNATLKWSLGDDPSKVHLVVWKFTRSGSKKPSEELGRILPNKDIIQSNSTSLPAFAIKKPATLVLTNVSERHNGEYRSIVQILAHANRNDEVNVSIAVKPTVTTCSSPVTVVEGNDLTCECQGQGGNPPANVTWFKDDIQIGEIGKEEQTLTRRNVSVADSGTYKCVAESYSDAKFKDEGLITVIVKRKFKTGDEGESSGLSGGAITGIILGVLALLVIVVVVVYFCCCKSKEKEGYRRGNHRNVDQIEMDDNAVNAAVKNEPSGSKSNPQASTLPVYAAVDKNNREGKSLSVTSDTVAKNSHGDGDSNSSDE